MFSRLLMGSIYFLFAFTVSIVTIYLCFKVVMRITRYEDIELLKKNNVAVAFVQTAAFNHGGLFSICRHRLSPRARGGRRERRPATGSCPVTSPIYTRNPHAVECPSHGWAMQTWRGLS